MKLSQVPFDSLSVGDRVISAIGTDGEITKIFRHPHHTDDDELNFLSIKWSNGNESHGPQCDMKFVELCQK